MFRVTRQSGYPLSTVVFDCCSSANCMQLCASGFSNWLYNTLEMHATFWAHLIQSQEFPSRNSLHIKPQLGSTNLLVWQQCEECDQLCQITVCFFC